MALRVRGGGVSKGFGHFITCGSSVTPLARIEGLYDGTENVIIIRVHSR